MRIERGMPFSAYMRAFLKEADGRMWAFVSIADFLVLIDVLTGTQFAPIREQADFGKAIVLLAFSPLLLFLTIAVLQQLPLSSRRFSSWMRALVCLGAFLILNF
jgi:hypothetical protein